MNGSYRPNLGGFSAKLGLKNGIYDLIKRPVPKQEELLLKENDINGVKPVSVPGNYYRGRKRQRRR